VTYLLDTNVISQFASGQPEPAVENWMRNHRNAALFLSVITIGEIRQGIEQLPLSQKRENLNSWLYETLLADYNEFILPLTTDTMLIWGTLTGKLMKQGRKLPVMDGLIAATAVQHNLTLITRNGTDFTDVDIALINPWIVV
jgi:toxin FitB